MGTFAVLLLASVLPAAAENKVVVKDPDGQVLAVILDCNSCPNPAKGKACESGAENGYLDGKPCGKCLLDANFPTRISYPYDLQFIGYLKDETGQPLKNKFVRLYLPNTWTVRTRTGDDGMFRLLLGATAERKGKAQVIKIGDHVMPKDSKSGEYALFMLPENYKPCSDKPAEKK
ncbi:MAG: hypothetical protein SF182_00455 [Deltaproteobacteria bacterium]|nr:hypothetical protein [Deltaproteobacteria bacterium]